jgi:hypothetical protein
MKKIICIIFLWLVFISNLLAQNKIEHYLGTDLLEFTTTTVNLNYSFDVIPLLTPAVEAGYTINFAKSGFNLPDFLSMTSQNSIYHMDTQKGSYLKAGTYFNFRKQMDKANFFHLGLFITASSIYERGYHLSDPDNVRYYQAPEEGYVPVSDIEYQKKLIGISTSIGYEFRLLNRVKMAVDYQLSYPLNRQNQLYGFRNFISGMGYNENKSNFLPLLTLVLKYKL